MDSGVSTVGSDLENGDNGITTTLNLLSLHQDAWSECLKFLSPPEIAMASTQICKGLSSPSPSNHHHSENSPPNSNNQNCDGDGIILISSSSSERASWLALESAIQKADRIVADDGREGNNINDQQYTLRRYPGETWMELYALFWSILSTAVRRIKERNIEDNNTNINHSSSSSSNSNSNRDGGRDEEEDDDDDDMRGEETGSDNAAERTASTNGTTSTQHHGMTELFQDDDKYRILWITICWLLFGWPERLPPSSSTILALLDDRHGYGVDDESSNASDLLLPTENVPYNVFLGNILYEKLSQQSIRFRLRHRVRILQSALRLSDSGHWEGASNLLGTILVDNDVHNNSTDTSNDEIHEDDADINICICTFLIDRLYSNTFVTSNTNDSTDLSRAVSYGREAVALCQSTQQQAGDMDTSEIHNAATNNCQVPNQQQQHNPPPPVLLYPTDSVRLAGACLALGKALALLAQHIGLRATILEDIDVRPIETGDDDHDLRSIDERFFREGEAVLKSSIRRLEEEEEELLNNNASNDDYDSSNKMVLFEMLVASYAALGELYYCSASVASYHDPDQCARQTEGSIKFLTMSLRLSQQRIVEGIQQQQQQQQRQAVRTAVSSYPITVESLCSTAPRSLMLLQVRTAKDLGKVYSFAASTSSAGSPHIALSKGKDVLDFALAVSLRLHSEGHPSVSNIRRLNRHHPPSSTDCIEDEVNRWLCQNPLFDVL